ncbi:1-acyl-sn-glycerol-3-phosphate acyltransferase [Butyrivibrio sp. INlla16]|uniref:lysophospholipid acyltransferase family protein n=1 Tax=Butyrivibrio sp. INlla16 TaxID=1520807 RepID=UPI0008808284|nr:lysophospholipid acyltransferase family protein [Butyrivibrio sp. INlla16]SDB64880.1 1-acyl-sn-glycerol-3-phosphate acyltransferase [Butyrivibrio sp. INlla16]
MIRFILVLLFLIIFFLCSIVMHLVLWIVGKFNLNAKKVASLRIVSWAFRCVAFLSGAKLTVIGEENVPKDTAVLYVGNHRSYYDIVLSYSRVPRITGYIAKKEILKVPILSQWMRNMDCLFLDRDDIRQGLQVILSAIDKVKNGISITIYPEGTRNGTDEMLPFHKGSFKIAQKTGCPIVPMTINNSNAIFEDHIPFLRKSHVVLEYGEPIYLDKLDPNDKKNIETYCYNIIKETYEKNKALV